MKKFIRLISLLVLLCICLSGCNYLDELRSIRGHFTEDGGIRLCDGTEYRLLPENEYFSPDYFSYLKIATDPDTPLLLIGNMGDAAYITYDKQFICVYTVEDGYRHYCRADLYDSLLPRFTSEFVPDICCYSYYDSYQGKTVEYLLTSSQIDALLTVLNTQEPTQPSGMIELNYEWCNLTFYSQDYLFFQDTADLCYADGRYFLLAPGFEFWVYEIPEELIPEFEAIMQPKLSLNSK